jgi:hypothetical protein
MLDMFGEEMPLATRLVLACLILLALIGAIVAAAVGVSRHRHRAASSSPLPTIRMRHDGAASDIFKFLFWIHQLLLGLPSVSIGLDLVIQGQTIAIINAIGLLLAWIGGTLVWGLAAIMHRRPVYELPPVIAAINENIARLEKMQIHEIAVDAVGDELAGKDGHK